MGILKIATQGASRASVSNDTSHQHNYVGAPSFTDVNPYGFLKAFDSDRYASIYPSVKAISNEFMTIRPFGINAKAEVQKDNPIIRTLYHPNKADSAVAFREKLAVMAVTHRKYYLLTWRNDGGKARAGGDLGFKGDKLAGLTFLENPAILRTDGKTTYRIGAQEFTEDEVLVIPGGVDPNNLSLGYCAGEASRKWAKLDDYIADFQTGFFENGAVPAGQFIITTSSEEDFKDTVKKMQDKHRGAGNNENVTYTPRPVNKKDGTPGEAKIEWIPFGTTNKEMDFKNIFEQANKRMDSAFGVPASVRGVGENNNYATARLDRENFLRNTINPLALRIYTQLTHELNRVTGGTGISITYELDYPIIADEEKVVEETKKIKDDRMIQLLDKGFTMESIDEYFISGDVKDLVKPTPEEQDDEDVDDGNEVGGSPDPDDIDGIKQLKGKKKVRGKAKSKRPKAEATDFDKFYAVAKKTMQDQIDRAVSQVTEEDISNEVNPTPTIEDEDDFIDEMMVVVTAVVLVEGAKQYTEGKKLLEDAGESVDTLTEFSFTDDAQDKYRAYLRKVAGSYMPETADSIRKALANAKELQKTLAETKKDLKNIIDLDEYRIKRLAETELNRANAMGSIESMIEIHNQTGVEIEKGLVHGGGDAPCEFCVVLLDRWVLVQEVFIAEGDSVFGADGGVYLNKFANNEGFDVHPNGHCHPQYRVKPE